MQILKKLKFEILIFALFVFVHVWNLGHDNFNTDVWKWKQRSYDFGTGVYGLQFEKTFQKYHPGVTLMWVGSTGVKISNFITQDILPKFADTDIKQLFLLDTIQKNLLVLAIGFALTFSFYVIRQLFGTRFALFSFILLILEPFYLGLTRVFHLEGTMSTLMLSSVLWLYYFFIDQTKKKRLFVSAIFGGLAFLTKTSSLFLAPFVGFALIFLAGIISYQEKLTILKFKKPVILGIQWFLVSLIVFILLWPVMWVNPGKALAGLYEGIAGVGIESEHAQMYFGKLVSDPGTLFYFVVLAYRTSAWLFIGFFGALYLFFTKKFAPKVQKMVLFLLAYSLLYFIEITIPTKKLDRYILPSILSLSLVSSFFYCWVVTQFKKYKMAIAVLFILPAILTAFYLHYDYLAYYSPLFGGLRKGIYVIEPKWFIGEPEVMAYFKKLKQDNKLEDAPSDKSFEEMIYKKSNINSILSVGFQEKYYTQIWPFFREMNSWAIIMELRPFAKNTRYFVYPVWNDESQYEWRFKLKEIGKIYKHGVPLYTVYERVI